MKYRKLANTNEQPSAIGLGTMGMNHAYREPDDKDSIATLNLALDLGINFWDTADVYAKGENEKLVSEFLAPSRFKIAQYLKKLNEVRANKSAWLLTQAKQLIEQIKKKYDIGDEY